MRSPLAVRLPSSWYQTALPICRLPIARMPAGKPARAIGRRDMSLRAPRFLIPRDAAAAGLSAEGRISGSDPLFWGVPASAAVETISSATARLALCRSGMRRHLLSQRMPRCRAASRTFPSLWYRTGRSMQFGVVPDCWGWYPGVTGRNGRSYTASTATVNPWSPFAHKRRFEDARRLDRALLWRRGHVFQIFCGPYETFRGVRIGCCRSGRVGEGCCGRGFIPPSEIAPSRALSTAPGQPSGLPGNAPSPMGSGIPGRAPALLSCPPPRCLAPKDERKGDGEESGSGDPERGQREDKPAGPMGGVRGQGLGVQDNALTRPFAHQLLQVLHQLRQALGRLDQGFKALPQPRLGAAILEHPGFDQRPPEGPDIGSGVEAPADPF